MGTGTGTGARLPTRVLLLLVFDDLDFDFDFDAIDFDDFDFDAIDARTHARTRTYMPRGQSGYGATGVTHSDSGSIVDSVSGKRAVLAAFVTGACAGCCCSAGGGFAALARSSGRGPRARALRQRQRLPSGVARAVTPAATASFTSLLPTRPLVRAAAFAAARLPLRRGRPSVRLGSSSSSSGNASTTMEAGSEPKTAAVGADVGNGDVPTHRSLAELRFESTFVEALPADPERRNFVRQVRHAAYSLVEPTPTWSAPTLAAWSPDCAADCFDLALPPLAGAEARRCEARERERAARVFSGLELLPGMAPYAQNYSGHQFGSFAGQLGDGRAISLGEYVNRRGERWEMQLKGAGKTPYSRFADGRAVMRSSIREFLCSEAMHHLGVPTTRALSLVATNDAVTRDMFYDGNARDEPGAVVCRVARSFIRFGTFQAPAVRGEHELLRQLADYTIDTHFAPDDEEVRRAPRDTEHNENRYALMFRRVVHRTAELAAAWQSVGFVHGVLNTDNCSVLGDTIDYGPYGWLDTYDPRYTPNTTDLPGRRYCFAMQPTILLWNLMELARALVPLTGVPAAERELEAYESAFQRAMGERVRRKMGFREFRGEEDQQLVNELYELMSADKCDFTRTWRALSRIVPADESENEQQNEGEEQAGANGKRALRRAGDELAPLADVLGERVTRADAAEAESRRAAWEAFVRRYRARWRADGSTRAESVERMHAASPKYVLRNYMAQQAIDRAEAGDYSEIDRLLRCMRRPYDEQPEFEAYAAEPPAWAQRMGVCMNSCSS